MNDLDVALIEAWNRVGPGLLGDEGELRRRLERRRNEEFRRPLRAWCVAVRAGDRRIADMDAVIVPRTAISLVAAEHPGRYAEHEVTLDKVLLERICAPVRIGVPGEPADHVARRLGCRALGLMQVRRNGFLRTDLFAGLMGRRGRPVPRVYNPTHLDPQRLGRGGADDIFACSWVDNVARLPEGFEQTLRRRPNYWRLHERQEEQFIGWLWVCPKCGRTARTVYCPVEQPDLPTLLGFAPAMLEPMPRPEGVFACRKCHRVQNFSRMHLSHDWNTLILRCTGGLLYGSEVRKPEWLRPARKHAFAPRRHVPARQRARIERWMAETELPYARIAEEMGLKRSTVAKQACAILKQHGVHKRRELQKLLGDRRTPAMVKAG